MENEKIKLEIDRIVKEKKILWTENNDTKNSFKKVETILSPLAIFLLLFLIPVFNIFKIKSSGEFLIGLLLAVFLLWFWFRIFRLLILRGNVISPWILGLIDRATNSEKVQKAKKGTNLFMGIFFCFFGFMFLAADPEDLTAKGLSLGFSAIFVFLGIIGITHYVIAKKPERVLFLVKRSRLINFLILLLISIFCFSVIISLISYIF